MQRYVYSSGPHTKTSYQDTKENQKKTEKDLVFGGSRKIFRQELPMSIPEDIFRQAPTQSIFRVLMQKPLGEDWNSISKRSSHKDPEENVPLIARKDLLLLEGINKIEMQEPPKSMPEELSYKRPIQAFVDSSQGHIYARIYTCRRADGIGSSIVNHPLFGVPQFSENPKTCVQSKTPSHWPCGVVVGLGYPSKVDPVVPSCTLPRSSTFSSHKICPCSPHIWCVCILKLWGNWTQSCRSFKIGHPESTDKLPLYKPFGNITHFQLHAFKSD